MAAHLGVLPAALAVLIIGCCFLRGQRRTGRAWPTRPGSGWPGSARSSTIFATYVFGDMGIRIWLRTSVDRTTIFAQLLLYAEIALWLVVALDAATGRRTGHRRSDEFSRSASFHLQHITAADRRGT